MSFDQLSQRLRQARSRMPRVSSEKAYAQMDRLRAAQMSLIVPKNRNSRGCGAVIQTIGGLKRSSFCRTVMRAARLSK